MTLHKIPRVDKSTCAAEQKIAYNIAVRIGGDCRYKWDEISAAAETAAIEDYKNTWLRDYPREAQKYDTRAIFCALRAGLHNYLCGGCRLLSSFEAIGQAFPVSSI